MEETYFQDWGGPKDPRKKLKTVVIDRDTFDFRKYENFHDLVEGIYCFFYFNQYAAILHNFLYPARISKFFHQQPTFLVKQKMISFSHMNIVYPTMIFFISSIEGFF